MEKQGAPTITLEEEEVLFLDNSEYHDMGGEDEEEDDIDICDDGSNLDDETKLFDKVIELLEEAIVDPDFELLKEKFCQENCHHFEDTNENKLIYMDLFNQYSRIIELFIESRLQQQMPDMDLVKLMAMVEKNKDGLVSDAFDLLVSLADFEAYKELMLSYKTEAQGSGFKVACMPMAIHTEEQEDGEERPDLAGYGLRVCSMSPLTSPKPDA